MTASSEVAKEEDALVSLRDAAVGVRTVAAEAPGLTFYPALADWFDAAAEREQARADECAAACAELAEPAPGDEIYAAAALARAWLEDG